MILIVGGLGQGKSAFAAQCQKEEISGGRPGRTAAVFNGRKGKPEQAFAAGFQSAMTMLAAGLSCPTVKRQEVSGNGKS